MHQPHMNLLVHNLQTNPENPAGGKLITFMVQAGKVLLHVLTDRMETKQCL